MNPFRSFFTRHLLTRRGLRMERVSLWDLLRTKAEAGLTFAAPETDPLAGYVDMPRWWLHKPSADKLAPRTRRFSLN